MDNVKYVPGRFFIDIAVSGCGSGCTYCYVETAKGNQILLTQQDIVDTVNYIKNNTNYKAGKNGSIISLCPNTEPFKTSESSLLIRTILESFLPMGNIIQISTKEEIPEELLVTAEKLSIFERQVYFFISTSSITKANIVEPYAAPIDIRFKNFQTIKKHKKITSCMYIKPFCQYTADDLQYYIEKIEGYSPDAICVGVDFIKRTILQQPCDLLYHDKEIIDKALNSEIEFQIKTFSNCIQEKTLMPVFHSSTCVLSKFTNIPFNPNIKKVAIELCIECISQCKITL